MKSIFKCIKCIKQVISLAILNFVLEGLKLVLKAFPFHACDLSASSERLRVLPTIFTTSSFSIRFCHSAI